jgi:ubiquinone/menaquinone biosynthesis C-methylase UbiE
MSNSNSEVKTFFSEISFVRDMQFTEHPILGYEQVMRQNAIFSLNNNEHHNLSLDAGCGNGRDFRLMLNNSNRVIGMDFTLDMVRNAKKKITKDLKNKIDLIVGDVTHLPFKNESFSFVLCSEVLEHVPCWQKALKEFERTLFREGSLIISTPNKFSMYGLTRYSGKLLLGSKHPYDKWKSFIELKEALCNSGFKFQSAKGACYLPGDISYYDPFKSLFARFIGTFRFLELGIRDSKPWSYLGYMSVLKGKKTEKT